MSHTLAAVFQTYIQRLKFSSRSDKQYAFALLTRFLTERYGEERLQALMTVDGPASWEIITKDSTEAFIAWQVQQGFSPGTIIGRANGMRKLYEVAADAGSLSQQEWGRIKDMSVSGVVRTSIEKRNAPYHQRLTTRKAHHTPLSMEQVRQLKQQPDTAQGRRDAFLLCLILDHHLSGTVLESLPAQALDVQKRTLYLSDGKSVLLSDDAIEAARRYVERAAPQDQLIQGSKRGGVLQGGMTARGQADRIRFLGKKIGIPSLSPQDCQLWDRPVRQSPKEATSGGDHPLLVPESVVPRSEDTRPRYDKRRLVLEVIQRKNGEDTVHYLGYDLFLARHLLASLKDVHGDFITVLNFYQRGQLGLAFPFACLDHVGKNELGFKPKD